MAMPAVVTLATTSPAEAMVDAQLRISELVGFLDPQQSWQPASIQFQINYGEKLYAGRYLFEDGELWVASNWGNKFTAAHALTADSLARVLLREIVDEAKARGELE